MQPSCPLGDPIGIQRLRKCGQVASGVDQSMAMVKLGFREG